VIVPVASVALGDLHATVRVSGTVAAQNFAALLAPRIMGSRTGMNRRAPPLISAPVPALGVAPVAACGVGGAAAVP